MAFGIMATLTLGVVGAAGWLVWVWSQTPATVRAGMSSTKIGIVVATACTCVALFFVGLIMTCIGLRRSFTAVSPTVDPSQKARVMSEGISEAMNWTAIGFVPLAIGALVVLIAGFRLIRATHV